MFNDDGAGIDFEKISERAIEKGLTTSSLAKSMTKTQLINLLFASEISTSEITDKDKGRGVGMSSILEAVQKLGGSITVKTNQVIGTTFIIDFPKELGKQNAIAA